MGGEFRGGCWRGSKPGRGCARSSHRRAAWSRGRGHRQDGAPGHGREARARGKGAWSWGVGGKGRDRALMGVGGVAWGGWGRQDGVLGAEGGGWGLAGWVPLHPCLKSLTRLSLCSSHSLSVSQPVCLLDCLSLPARPYLVSFVSLPRLPLLFGDLTLSPSLSLGPSLYFFFSLISLIISRYPSARFPLCLFLCLSSFLCLPWPPSLRLGLSLPDKEPRPAGDSQPPTSSPRQCC